MVLALNAKIRGYSGENIGIRGSCSSLPGREVVIKFRLYQSLGEQD